MPDVPQAMLLTVMQQLDESQWLPPDLLRGLQFRQLERLLAHAARTVPFYRDRMDAIRGVKVGSLGPEVWSRLPILRRADIQTSSDKLLSTDIPEDHLPTRDISTSGSTGRPITVKNSAITRLFFTALNLRYHIWHGRDLSGTVAAIRTMRGGMAEAAEKGTPTQWGCRVYRSGPMYYFDIRRPASEQLDWLEEVEPHFLLTFPSNLASLIRESQASGRRIPRLREIITMSETVDPSLRAACRQHWEVGLVDAYTAQEIGMMALQCPTEEHYHVQSEACLIEVLRDDHTPCEPGEVGRVVVTALHNFATPLIRYEIGDYAEVGAPCSCGRGLPVISRFLGRSRNLVVLPTGNRFWPRTGGLELDKIAAIRQFQFVQTRVEEIEARFVVDRQLTADEEDRLRANMRTAFGGEFNIWFVYVDEIPRAPSGKYEDFISLVDR